MAAGVHSNGEGQTGRKKTTKSQEPRWVSSRPEWNIIKMNDCSNKYMGGCCDKTHRWVLCLGSCVAITILPDSLEKTSELLCTLFLLETHCEVYFWSFSIATNTTELFLIGLRIKHLCSQVRRKVNYGLRSTENFQNDILKMSLPSSSPSLVYHNGIMSLAVSSNDLYLFFYFLYSSISRPTVQLLHYQSPGRRRWTWGQMGVCDYDSGKCKWITKSTSDWYQCE